MLAILDDEAGGRQTEFRADEIWLSFGRIWHVFVVFVQFGQIGYMYRTL